MSQNNNTQQQPKETALRNWLRFFQEIHSKIDIMRCFCIQAPSHWAIPSRVLDEHICYLWLEGSATCLHAQPRPWSWQPGHLQWVGPGIRHAVSLDDQQTTSRFYVLRFGLYQHDGVAIQAPMPSLDLPQAHNLRPYFERIDRSTHASTPLADLHQRLAITDLFTAICNRLLSGHQPSGGLSPEHMHVLQTWIQEHVRHQPCPEDLMQLLDLPAHSLRRRFMKSFGCSPRSWLRNQRIQHAADVLAETNCSVEECARLCAYDSLSSFSKQFVKVFDCRPGEWVKRQGIKP